MIIKMSLCCVILFFIALPNAFAKPPQKIAEAVVSNYPAAEEHKALDNAYFKPDQSKMRGYVVILKGGIPAERANYYIEWDAYDYRGADILLDKNDAIETRRGVPYTYLQPGDVMAVAGMKTFGRTIYLKLLSADVYKPDDRANEKRFSRVSVMLGFTFPKKVFSNDDAPEVIAKMGEWLKPFPNVNDAKEYASSLRPKTLTSNPGPETRISDKDKLKELEQKIEAARKQMEEADREIQKLKKEKK